MFYEDAPQYKEYLPDVWQDYVEIDALDHVIKIEMRKLLDYVKQNIGNKSIRHANEQGVNHWEKILHVSSPLNSTLRARKDALQAKLMTNPPINLNTLKAVVEAYMGLEVNVTVEDYTIKIRYRGVSRIADLKPLYKTAYDIIPANLIIDISYLWVTWGEIKEQYPTWGDVAKKTWDDLRKGV